MKTPFCFIFLYSGYPNNTATTQAVSRLIYAIRNYMNTNGVGGDIKVISGNSVFDVKNEFYYKDCEVIHMYKNKPWERFAQKIPGFSHFIYYPLWEFFTLKSVVHAAVKQQQTPVIISPSDLVKGQIWRSGMVRRLYGGVNMVYRMEKPKCLYRDSVKVTSKENYIRKKQKRKYRIWYNYFDALITETPTLSRYYDVLLKKKKPSIVIPTFADINPLPQIGLNQKSKKWVITYAGGLTPEKKDGVEYLVKAACLLDDNEVELQIVGNVSNDAFFSRLKEIAKDGGKTEISFHPNVSREEYMKALARTDIFVLYKERDYYTNAGVSSKLMEYMRCGKPVVLTKYVNYYPMSLIEGENAYFVDAEDEKKLAGKLKAVMESSTSLNVGVAGREELVNKLNPFDYCDSLYHFLYNIAQ